MSGDIFQKYWITTLHFIVNSFLHCINHLKTLNLDFFYWRWENVIIDPAQLQGLWPLVSNELEVFPVAFSTNQFYHLIKFFWSHIDRIEASQNLHH